MKPAMIISILLIFILFYGETLAVSPIVYDPTVDADIIQTFSFFEKEIGDLEVQINSLNEAIKILASGKFVWKTTNALIDQLNHTLEQSSGLSYSAKNEAAQFASLFPGYTIINNFNQQYQNLTKSSLDTFNNILQTLKRSADNFIDENSRLASLQQWTEGVVGQTQALQMAAQLASEQVSQLQLLRQSILAQANAEVVFYAQEIQKEASRAAELNALITAGDTQTSGNLANNPIVKPHYE